MSQSKRIDGIDLLRGVSIIAVVLTHINQRLPLEETSAGSWIPWFLSSAVLRSGYLGVVIFFVISGFLITSTSINRWGALGRLKALTFYSNRFARIAPPLLATLLVLSLLHICVVTGFVVDSERTSLGQAVFAALTFWINWLQAFMGGLPFGWSILWSLSIEEAFYLAFPIACIALKNTRHLAFLLSGLVVLAPFARTVLSENLSWRDHSYLSGMGGIALGCLTALWSSRFRLGEKRALVAAWVGGSLLVFSFLGKAIISKAGLTAVGLNVTLIEIATALLLLSSYESFRSGKSRMPRLLQPLCWFGRNSYEVYLTHLMLVIPLTGLIPDAKGNTFVVGAALVVLVGLSGILGEIVARFFSEPLNRYLRRNLAEPRG